MLSDELELTKLKLLALSYQRLESAQTDNWSQLQALDMQWQPLLSQSIEVYGKELESIFSKLNQDNEALIRLVEASQQRLNEDRAESFKGLSQVKQYLK